SRMQHTSFSRDWSSDVCSSDLVLADIGGDDLADLAFLDADAESDPVDTHVVGDDGEIADTGGTDRIDQIGGDTAEPETSDGEGHPVEEEILQRLDGRGEGDGHCGSFRRSAL